MLNDNAFNGFRFLINSHFVHRDVELDGLGYSLTLQLGPTCSIFVRVMGNTSMHDQSLASS